MIRMKRSCWLDIAHAVRIGLRVGVVVGVGMRALLGRAGGREPISRDIRFTVHRSSRTDKGYHGLHILLGRFGLNDDVDFTLILWSLP